MKQLIKNLLNHKSVHQNEIDFYARNIGLESKDFVEYLRLRGLDIMKNKDSMYSLGIFNTTIKDQIFCIVDIETNGPYPDKHSLIEIGAIKYKNGKIIDKFESLIHSSTVPKVITQVTGISIDDILEAPSERKVLNDFRIFLGNSIFVAHSVKWDYNFISKSFENYNLESMLNHKLCTLELARKYIKAPKYGLKTLNEVLNIDVRHHRAYDDAYSATKILEYCFDIIDTDKFVYTMIKNIPKISQKLFTS